MKVGIITIHAVPNYGAMLQSYALSSCLQELGFDAETIDYRQPAMTEYFRFRPRLIFPLKHWLRLKRCSQFVDEKLRKSSRRYSSLEEFLPHSGEYGAIITGSDQVWFTGPVQYYDRMFFLDFPAKGCRKISYAASAGGSTSFGEFEAKVRNALQGIDHLSVRDSHTEGLIKPLVDKKITTVLDPVFLNDFSAISTAPPPCSDPYLLVFGDFSGATAEIVRDAAQLLGLKRIVTLQYPNPVANQRVAAPGPQEWLNYIRNASFIVTSYFHGAALCVKFNRRFISLPTPGRRKKVLALLDEVGLSNRCLESNSSNEVWRKIIREEIDWKPVNKVVERRVAESRQFLLDALN